MKDAASGDSSAESPEVAVRANLPATGAPWEAVESKMEALSEQDMPWYSRKMFKGGSYFGREDVTRVANAAYAKYINYNQLYASTAFPSLLQFDREVTDTMLELLHAPGGAGGALTTGGTESILLSVKTAVHWAHEAKPELKFVEVIVPHACHPGFDKAAEMLGQVRMIRLPRSDTSYACDMALMRAAITPNTIMLVGSAPSYPFGISDDIATMSELAVAHDLWLHVDACNGGLVFPFANMLHHSGGSSTLREFDFKLPGVRSICADIHKLGYLLRLASSFPTFLEYCPGPSPDTLYDFFMYYV